MSFEVQRFLSEDERELLHVLTRRVRVMTVTQIARTWGPSGPSALVRAARSVKRLEECGLVVCFTAVVHPELPLFAPVARWRLGEPMPKFASVANKLRSRWSEAGVPARCVIASRIAGRMFGGHGGRFPRESEETHDVHLAAVYLKYRIENPVAASRWMHEEEIRLTRNSRSGKLPDALIQGGRERHVVEFGGAYKKAKLIAFHDYCKAQGLSYEVW